MKQFKVRLIDETKQKVFIYTVGAEDSHTAEKKVMRMHTGLIDLQIEEIKELEEHGQD